MVTPWCLVPWCSASSVMGTIYSKRFHIFQVQDVKPLYEVLESPLNVYLLSEQCCVTLHCVYFLSCQLEGNDFTLVYHGTQSRVIPEIPFLPKRSLSPPPTFTPATRTSCPPQPPWETFHSYSVSFTSNVLSCQFFPVLPCSDPWLSRHELRSLSVSRASRLLHRPLSPYLPFGFVFFLRRSPFFFFFSFFPFFF